MAKTLKKVGKKYSHATYKAIRKPRSKYIKNGTIK